MPRAESASCTSADQCGHALPALQPVRSPSQAIRKSFLSLFTRKALNTYIQCQDGVIRRHLSEWLAQHSGQELDVKRIVRSAVAA